ncbi:MAG: cytochrome c biogenesis CcdA family protein [Oligosphaeraceae bacterium]
MSPRAFLPALLLSLLLQPLQGRPFFLLFGSESCDDCRAFRQTWEDMATPQDPLLVYLCIDREANYLFLRTLEETLSPDAPASSFPLLLAGTHFVEGVERFQEECREEWFTEPVPGELAPLLPAVEAAGNLPLLAWDAPETPDAARAPGEPRLSTPPRLLYLASPGCAKCARQEQELKRLKERLPSLQVTQVLFSDTEGLVYMERVRTRFQIPEDAKNLTPLVAWGSGYLHGRTATAEELLDILQQETQPPWWLREIQEAERQATLQKADTLLTRLTWTMILNAGLADGINPCAFATIVFLVSYLLYLKRRRSFVLAVGACFCLGVFLSYLLYGVSLGFLVHLLNKIPLAKVLLYAVFGALGLLFFFLHLRDTLRFRKNRRVADMEMGLGVQTHRKIHGRIHSWAKLPDHLAIPAAILLGCLISAMELACTGQVYLPTIVAIMDNGFQPRAFRMLLAYNVAFILPLLGVTLAAYWGTGAEALASWAKRHLLATKVAMTLLFLAMAAYFLAMAVLALP